MSDRPVRAALLGVGAWARVLAAAAARSSRITLACCWGRTAERVAAFSRETGIPASDDLRSVLADRAIDAVILALPNERHFEFAQLAAAAGKHVYIEKPIANTLEDGVRTAALQRIHSIRIVVGHCARLLGGNRIIRAAIDRGELGRVTQIEANFSNDRALRLSPADWRWYQAGAPGGPLSQIAIHQFDTLRFLGGDIAAVSAAAARHSPVGAEVEDQWTVSVRFADGKLGSVISNWTSPGTYSVRATGDAALMFYEIDQTRWSVPERLHENALLYRQARGAGPEARQRIEVPAGNMYCDELELFAAAITGSSDCELSADSACRALAAVYASLASVKRNGAFVSLDEMLAAARASTPVTQLTPEVATWQSR